MDHTKDEYSMFSSSFGYNLLLLAQELLRRFAQEISRIFCSRACHEGRGCSLHLFVTLVWKLANYAICGVGPDSFNVRCSERIAAIFRLFNTRLQHDGRRHQRNRVCIRVPVDIVVSLLLNLHTCRLIRVICIICSQVCVYLL